LNFSFQNYQMDKSDRIIFERLDSKIDQIALENYHLDIRLTKLENGGNK